MGPSVKFVSCINGSFSKKKTRGNFFIRKNTKPWGCPEVWRITRRFPIFFVKPSLTYSTFVTLKCFNKYDFMYRRFSWDCIIILGNIFLQELECADSAEPTIGSFEAKFLSRFNPEEEFPPAEQSTPPRPI